MNSLMRSKPASEDKSPPSKFILICLLLSKAKVFTILIKGSFVCIINGFEHLNFTTNGCSFLFSNYVAFSHFHGCAVNNLG